MDFNDSSLEGFHLYPYAMRSPRPCQAWDANQWYHQYEVRMRALTKRIASIGLGDPADAGPSVRYDSMANLMYFRVGVDL